MHPRSLRHPLPINKHTPALSTPPSLAPNTRLLPRVQHILQNLIIETARLQPNAFNPQLLRFLEYLLRDFRGRDDGDRCFGWVGQEGEGGERGVGV